MKLRHTLLLTALSLTAGAAFGATAAENWDNYCAKCHGPNGAGKTVIGKKLKLKDYTDDAVQAAMKDDDMFKATKDGVKDESGKERMKPYKADLSDAEINELVAHIRKMKK
ncbi:MAG: hypothetical protein A3G75_00175 [Verrucomicrobia bacterium RIFCSPLOWO2_12_FULL_64_8]|nr:MAG: hypothetical protein A3G75_00175 [Verrucomicrobia bacterium RIFCSPLOWO2_12_FULL_64_8]